MSKSERRCNFHCFWLMISVVKRPSQKLTNTIDEKKKQMYSIIFMYFLFSGQAAAGCSLSSTACPPPCRIRLYRVYVVHSGLLHSWVPERQEDHLPEFINGVSAANSIPRAPASNHPLQTSKCLPTTSLTPHHREIQIFLSFWSKQ
jgi:hypothetical protein